MSVYNVVQFEKKKKQVTVYGASNVSAAAFVVVKFL